MLPRNTGVEFRNTGANGPKYGRAAHIYLCGSWKYGRRPPESAKTPSKAEKKLTNAYLNYVNSTENTQTLLKTFWVSVTVSLSVRVTHWLGPFEPSLLPLSLSLSLSLAPVSRSCCWFVFLGRWLLLAAVCWSLPGGCCCPVLGGCWWPVVGGCWWEGWCWLLVLAAVCWWFWLLFARGFACVCWLLAAVAVAVAAFENGGYC